MIVQLVSCLVVPRLSGGLSPCLNYWHHLLALAIGCEVLPRVFNDKIGSKYMMQQCFR